jgi:hypothetical protein
MKKTLAVLTLLAGAVSGYSQGQVGWADYLNSDFQITIWSPQTATPTVQVTGNSPGTFGTGLTSTGADIPAGTQTGYTGTPLGGSATGATSPTDYANGNLWSVQLYAAAGGSTPTPVAGAVANMFTSGNAGLYNVTGNPVVTIPNVAAGASASLQLAAWYNAGGTISSYAAAVAAGGAAAPSGLSTIGTENLGGGVVTPPDLPGPGNSGVTGGITSFSLVGGSGGSTTPEPSTIALGIMGASAFLMRLRRK